MNKKKYCLYLLLGFSTIMLWGCANTFRSLGEEPLSMQNVGQGVVDDNKDNWQTLQSWGKKYGGALINGSKVVAGGVASGLKATAEGISKGSHTAWEKMNAWDDQFREEWW
jgi:hypothetical protein